MKASKRLLAALMALIVVAVPAHGLSQTGAAETGSEAYTLTPRVSDGLACGENTPGSLSVLAHEEGDMLVFDETKSLIAEVVCAEGWTLSTKYSHFFPGDDRAYLLNPESGVYEFFFEAREGESVYLSEWQNAAINASCGELPKLYIDTEISFDEIGREEWVDATFSLILGTKEFASGDYEGTGSVKGRGNSSWMRPKKPYSIKLSSKASLLDIPKTKKYAIIPGYDDTALMRNYITYKIWQGLYGVDYVPKCEFVDVYLNGEYNGIYTLVERIDIEKSKIDIPEADADNLTGGYLIEKDVAQKIDFDSDYWFHCPYWANQSKDYFVLKAPEPEEEELKSAMLSYLEDYMQRVHDSIMGESGEPYTDYVDVSSWIDFIIVQEIAKNIDGNFKTSCFMIKQRDDDRLYMTALWDFDLAYGRVSWNNQSEEHNAVTDCPPANTADGFMVLNSSNPWMDMLYDNFPEFRTALMQRYTQYRPTLIEDMFRLIDEQAAYLAQVQDANYQLWGKNFSIGVTNLRAWLRNRIAWLDTQWLITEYELGDYNMDGVVDMSDGLLAVRRAMELEPETNHDYLADMDGDGVVSAADALLIIRKAMGLE